MPCMIVITHLGHQPESHKYFSSGVSFYSVIITPFLSSFLNMAESSELFDNPEVTRVLQVVIKNLLSPTFQVGDTQSR